MNSSKIRFGVIGCSSIANKSFIPAILESKSAVLSMLGSRSKEKALEFSKKFGCDSFGNYEEVIENKDIDAVYISLPVGLHEEWAIRAAKAGKHILCEKSSADSLDSAKRMVKKCRENKVRILEGFMFRYHPQHVKVLSMIDEGLLGDLLMFHGHFGFPIPSDNNHRMKKELGGGSLNDGAAYPIYASRMLFGAEPLSVCCRLKIKSGRGVDTKADIFLSYNGGKSAFASSAFGAYFQSTYSLWGTKSFLKLKRAYAVPKDMSTGIFWDSNDSVSEIIIEPQDHFRLMVDDFCREISGRKHTRNFEDDLLAQARVMEAARLSHKEERIVNMSEIEDF